MNVGRTAGTSQTLRGRFLLAAGGAAGALLIAAGVSIVLELTVDAAPVALPPALGSGMVPCPPPADSAGDVPDDGFWIDRFEVTVSDYNEFLRETGRTMPLGAPAPFAPWTGPGFLPVTCVPLSDAREFASWRGKRLPTSEEWEWAARGPADFLYPWGERFVDTFANTSELGLWGPTIVGTFFNGQSFCGAYDLVGNVWEWTETRAAGFEVRYVVRGGSFLSPGRDSMDAPPTSQELEEWPPVERGRAEPDGGGWSRDVGFRCVADSAAVERDHRLRHALEALGARDPLQYLFRVRPAMSELAAAGEEARWLLSRALRVNRHPLVRKRIERLLGVPPSGG